MIISARCSVHVFVCLCVCVLCKTADNLRIFNDNGGSPNIFRCSDKIVKSAIICTVPHKSMVMPYL